MIKVVAFIIENFPDIHACPHGDNLGNLLLSAGFDEHDIQPVLFLMHLLNEPPLMESETLIQNRSIRLFSPDEMWILPFEVRSLICFLENANAINPVQRELIIHALSHMQEDEINLDMAKTITLLVLWSQRAELPALIGAELISVLSGKEIMH